MSTRLEHRGGCPPGEALAARPARPRAWSSDGRGPVGRWGGARGQGTIEVALLLPLFLLLVCAVIAVGRVTLGTMSVNAVAREMARAGAQTGKTSAAAAGYTRGQQVADGYGLTNGSLTLTMHTANHQPGGDVWSTARYVIRFDDIPLLGWASWTVTSRGHERIDRYR